MEKENLLLDLPEYLNKVLDPRDAVKVQYPLAEILFLTVSAVISDCSEWQEIIEFGEDKLLWLRKFYPFKNGIPSHDTLNRVFSIVDEAAFQAVFKDWSTEKLNLTEGTSISIDGKKLRSSASKKEQNTSRKDGGKSSVHLVEAWCNELLLCLAVRKVDSKSNEITAIPLILDDLNIEGSVISIDAIGCQKSITQKISEGKADYVIGIKANQPTLLKAVEDAFKNFVEVEDQFFKEDNIDHGRLEERTCSIIKVSELPDWNIDEQWVNLNTIIRLRSGRFINAKGSVSYHTRYLISSLQLTAEKIAGYVRGHWGIENRLHWCIDVYYNEDASRKRKGNAATNFGTAIRIAHNLVGSYPEKRTIKCKRKKCARSDEYRERIMRIHKK
jgi:predicted transposase YbfD/YdcC